MMKMSMTLVSMLTTFTISESRLQYPRFDFSKHLLAPSGMIILINVLLFVKSFSVCVCQRGLSLESTELLEVLLCKIT